MRVWVLRNPDGRFRGKFHRHDSHDCRGPRMHEEKHADSDDDVLVDLEELRGSLGACQFECCFAGLPDAAAVAESHRAGAHHRNAPTVANAPRARAGTVVIGSTVSCRDVASDELKHWEIAGARRGDPARGEVSPESLIARALVGRCVGETVRIALPRGSLEVPIVAVDRGS
jgi:hypothetical protein